jgi:hypothetical protein
MSNQFRFYGTVLKGDGKVGYWHVEFDLFPEYDPRHDKVTAAVENLEVLQAEGEIDESCELALSDSSDDEQHDNTAETQKKKAPKKRKSRKVLAIESFLQMSDEGVLSANNFHHFHGDSVRQGILGLEDCWPTKNPWFRLVTTVIGMCVVDLHRYDRNIRSGGAAFDWLSSDDEQPEFLKVRSMANLIGRGLRKPEMRYYNNSNPRQTIKLRRSSPGQELRELTRITNSEGEIARPSCGEEKRRKGIPTGLFHVPSTSTTAAEYMLVVQRMQNATLQGTTKGIHMLPRALGQL